MQARIATVDTMPTTNHTTSHDAMRRCYMSHGSGREEGRGGRKKGRSWGRAPASDAVAAGEEVLDVPVVLEQEMELDHVVDREDRAKRSGSIGVGVGVVEEHRGL